MRAEAAQRASALTPGRQPSEGEAVALVVLVLAALALVMLIAGFNVGPHGWPAGSRCRLTLASGFICEPLAAGAIRRP